MLYYRSIKINIHACVCVCVMYSEKIAQSYKFMQDGNFMSEIMHIETSFWIFYYEFFLFDFVYNFLRFAAIFEH